MIIQYSIETAIAIAVERIKRTALPRLDQHAYGSSDDIYLVKTYRVPRAGTNNKDIIRVDIELEVERD